MSTKTAVGGDDFGWERWLPVLLALLGASKLPWKWRLLIWALLLGYKFFR